MSEISAISNDNYGGGSLGGSTDILSTQAGRQFGRRSDNIDGKKKWWCWCVWMIITVLKMAFSNVYYYIYTYQHHHFFLPSIFSERPQKCRPDCVDEIYVLPPREPPPELSCMVTLISDITRSFLAVNSTIVEHSSAAFLFCFWNGLSLFFLVFHLLAQMASW